MVKMAMPEAASDGDRWRRVVASTWVKVAAQRPSPAGSCSPTTTSTRSSTCSKNLRPYWRRNGWEAADLLKAAAKDYESLEQALRRVRRRADGRPDQGRRREIRQALRAGLSPVLRRGQVRRRRQRPAALSSARRTTPTAASAPRTCSTRWRRSSCCSARRWPSRSSCRS